MDEAQLRDAMYREITLVEDIIKRMASNSFQIKAWTVTLVVGSLVLKNGRTESLVAFIPLIAFWYLDGYFLRTERLYRKLYAWLVANRRTTENRFFDMDVSHFHNDVGSTLRVMFSQTLLVFYGMVTIMAAIYVYVVHFA
jgi:hypothetical protein